jgi:hypothetical protein
MADALKDVACPWTLEIDEAKTDIPATPGECDSAWLTRSGTRHRQAGHTGVENPRTRSMQSPSAGILNSE